MDAKPQKIIQKRYSPEVRRAMILDHTAELVNSEGVSSLSMERISESAGISKSLMYKYFDSLNDLLQELLRRELKSLRRMHIEIANGSNTFEELIRRITRLYLEYIEEHGLILVSLQADPSISQSQGANDYGRAAAVDYVATIAAERFELSLPVARATTDISFGLSISAGEYLLKGDMTREEIENLTVTMIVGTFTMVREEHRTDLG